MTAALKLMAWTSPAFPVGAFAYSHGLEQAVDDGLVRDAATLSDWLADLLRFGAPRSDAILFASAWKAADDAAQLAAINDLALALAGSRERLLETGTQGDAFVAAARAAWPPIPKQFGSTAESHAYPVAFAALAAAHGIPLEAALRAFSLGIVANLVSAAVRLGAVGQSDGQRVIASLLAAVEALAAMAAEALLDDLGGAAFRSDIAALRHETLYSRLFRS